MNRRLSNRPDEKVLLQLAQTKRLALRVVTAVACIILALWFLPPLARFAPPIWSKMTANTALGMLLAATGFSCTAQGRPAKTLWVGRLAALAVLAIGAIALVEDAAGTATAFDHWLPHDPHAHHFGRPSPQTALGLVLVALALLLGREHKSWRSAVADALALGIIGLTLVLLGGFFYGAFQAIQGNEPLVRTSPQTLLCFCCLAFVIAGRRARNGRFFSSLVSVGIGSAVVRVLLMGALVAPFLFFAAALDLVEWGIVAAPYAYAAVAALESFSVLCVIIWLSRRINNLELDLRSLSLTDELTQINNRRGFYLLAQQVFRDAARSGADITLLYFDLDGLKQANDRFGHDAGSRLIQAFAGALLESFRQNDVVGRLGGDEFAVVTASGSINAKNALDRLERRIAELNASGVLACPVRYSVGFVDCDPGDEAGFDALIKRADMMMYQEKQRKAAQQVTITK